MFTSDTITHQYASADQTNSSYGENPMLKTPRKHGARSESPKYPQPLRHDRGPTTPADSSKDSGRQLHHKSMTTT
ncbi:MAG: minor structural protein (endogenous virus) [Lactobacillus phage ViSo-2018b]|nr:MAG: minor structural protein [Lactobacillus phage ViSo-2018b]